MRAKMTCAGSRCPMPIGGFTSTSIASAAPCGGLGSGSGVLVAQAASSSAVAAVASDSRTLLRGLMEASLPDMGGGGVGTLIAPRLARRPGSILHPLTTRLLCTPATGRAG